MADGKSKLKSRAGRPANPLAMALLAKRVIGGELDPESAARIYDVSLWTAYKYIRLYRAKMSDADAICMALKAELRREKRLRRAV